METKVCTTCGVEKAVTDFHWHRKEKNIRRHACKVCRSNEEKERQRTDQYKAKRTEYLLNKHYGLTPEMYQQKLEDQGNVCAICGERCCTGKRLAVDHNHNTGAVRALLCSRCNQGLGLFQDNPELLNKAAEYLRTHNG